MFDNRANVILGTEEISALSSDSLFGDEIYHQNEDVTALCM